jgi:hypothetical protein
MFVDYKGFVVDENLEKLAKQRMVRQNSLKKMKPARRLSEALQLEALFKFNSIDPSSKEVSPTHGKPSGNFLDPKKITAQVDFDRKLNRMWRNHCHKEESMLKLKKKGLTF